MKKLVALYSRTGNTREIGIQIALNLKADIDEIIDYKNRKGIINWIIASKDALLKKQTKIISGKQPSKYDLVVVGTPVWAGKMTPAARTYLIENKNKFKKISFFCTCGGSSNEKIFKEMALLSKKPVNFIAVREKDIKKKNYQKELKKFCDSLKIKKKRIKTRKKRK